MRSPTQPNEFATLRGSEPRSTVPFATPTPHLGRKIHGYLLVERLGEGGMGEVWSARPTGGSAGRDIRAIKLLKSRSRDGESRLVREARLARRIRHPNVIEVGELLRSADGTLGLSMEKLDGETLGDLITAYGPLPLPFVACIGSSLASALAAAHALGIVHRDVKPSNVFVAREGGFVRPKLLDFGIAARVYGDAAASTVEIMGTPGYMAPEQCLASGDVRVDIWALGVVLYECFTGTRLFDGHDIHQVMARTFEAPISSLRSRAPHVPPAIADLVASMLERDPSRRLADLRLVYDTLGLIAGFTTRESIATAETIFRDVA